MFSSNKDVSFVPFHWAHPYHMDLREFDRAYFDNLPDYHDRLKMFAMGKHAYTAICDGKMVCCFGFTELWKGVAEGWLLTDYQIERMPISLTRGALRAFNHVAIDMKLHRLHLVVDARNELANRWAIALKFNSEGRMYGYGPDKSDHIMYARNF